MTSVFMTEAPPEVEAWLAQRREWGVDRNDEMWEGVLHVAPSPSGPHSYIEGELLVALKRRGAPRGLAITGAVNVGEKSDYRVSDITVHRSRPLDLYYATAAVVVEILSPRDETFKKFDFYAAHGVDELMVADNETRSVRVWELRDGAYVETGTSSLLEVSGAELAAEIDWP